MEQKHCQGWCQWDQSYPEPHISPRASLLLQLKDGCRAQSPAGRLCPQPGMEPLRQPLASGKNFSMNLSKFEQKK